MSNPEQTPERDADLHELLAAWFGTAPTEDRADHLLQRLRSDPGLRAAFVAEIRMHGMVRTALSAEPRWLEVQSELGLLETTAPSLATRISSAIGRHAAGRRTQSRLVWAIGLAAMLVVGAFGSLTWWRASTRLEGPLAFAVVVRSDGAREGSGARRRVEPQTVVQRGPFSLASGRLSLALLNGVSLHLEGPVELNLISDERIVCHTGRLRVVVPEGAEGFVVETPGALVTDLGTEFGVEVGGGATEVVVYRGQAEVALLSAGGQPQRSQIINERESWRIDPASGQMQSIAPREQLPAPSLKLPSLDLKDDYVSLIQSARPRHYWRGQAMAKGLVADAGSEPMDLLAENGVGLEADGSFVFGSDASAKYLIARKPWKPPAEGFAVELWFTSEAFRSSVLAIFSTPNAPADLCLLELTHRHRTRPVRPGEVRFLYRWPPGGTAGMNVFSSDIYSPYRWHHLVAQRRENQLELYLDGHLAGTTELPPGEPSTPVMPIFGRRRDRGYDYDPRQFEGRLAEIALYDRPLSPAEITAHASAQKRP